MKIIAVVEIDIKDPQRNVFFVDQAYLSIRNFFSAKDVCVDGKVLNFRIRQQDVDLKDIPDPD